MKHESYRFISQRQSVLVPLLFHEKFHILKINVRIIANYLRLSHLIFDPNEIFCTKSKYHLHLFLTLKSLT